MKVAGAIALSPNSTIYAFTELYTGHFFSSAGRSGNLRKFTKDDHFFSPAGRSRWFIL
ncbi:hypothetical protein QT976_23845 [Microcoleus sp. w2-18aC6]|uniref:hypothetical protein n=1 Tax=unclassified Microcoleus TaxID=2642155 RepID=UPI002FD75CD9